MAKRTADKRAPAAVGKDRGGRPQVFTDAAKAAEFLTWLRAGASKDRACAMVGCARRTIDHAMERDPEFAAKLLQAEAEGVAMAEICFTSAAKSDPRYALPFLARKDREKWAYKKPGVVTNTQFKSILDQVIAHFLNVVPSEHHAAMMQGVGDMLMSLLGGESIEEAAKNAPQV